MVRTWLLRGCAVAVFVVLAGAWAAGVVGHADDPVPAARGTVPDEPQRSPVTRVQPGSVLEKARNRHRQGTRSEAGSPSATPSEVDDPPSETPDVPTPSDTPHAPGSSDPTTDPPHSSSPHDPSGTPSDPGDGCSGLGGVLDCALDPVTGRP